MQNNSKRELDLRHTDKGIIIKIKVIPGSSKSQLCEITEGVLKIKLNAPPVEGAANKECINLLSKTFKIPKSNIKILNGEKTKNKTILLEMEVEAFKEKLDSILK